MDVLDNTGPPGNGAGRPRPHWCDTVDGQAVAFFAEHRSIINWAINDACVKAHHRADVRQDVAVRIIQRWRKKGPLEPGNHAAFAIRVARNACIDHFRRLPPPASQADAMPLADTAPDPEQQLIRLQGHERLHLAIASLTPLKRYLVRQVMAGRGLKELAEELERDHGSVKVLHHRAVKDLRKILIHR